MDWKSMIVYGFDSAAAFLEDTLKGLSATDLNVQPHPDCNSIGWTVWHLTRLPDDVFSGLLGMEQLWTGGGGWHQRFSMPADPLDTGFGHTPEQVRAFRSPDVETLMGYHWAALDRAKRFLGKLELGDLDRVGDIPWSEPHPTYGLMVQDVLSDCWLHAGEASYIKGLLKAQGRI